LSNRSILVIPDQGGDGYSIVVNGVVLGIGSSLNVTLLQTALCLSEDSSPVKRQYHDFRDEKAEEV